MMEIRRNRPLKHGSGLKFVGDAWIDEMVGTDSSPIRVSAVRFSPGARNAWHNHIHGQTLVVVDGFGRIQSRGGPVVEISQGDLIYTQPGEWHWHGAAPGQFMTHLAIMQGSGDPAVPDAEWGEAVTDQEYNS